MRRHQPNRDHGDPVINDEGRSGDKLFKQRRQHHRRQHHRRQHRQGHVSRDVERGWGWLGLDDGEQHVGREFFLGVRRRFASLADAGETG
ncbi:MAG: hypothetical protein ACTHMR_16905 [Thermomicrobiales bacterium]